MGDSTTPRSVLRSGQLARLAGVSTDTLRHYEKRGLLPRPRRLENGYREYPGAALERVRLIRRALAVGFTIPELARVLRVRDGGGAPCRAVHAIARQKLAEIDQQLERLTAAREELRALVSDWDAALTRTAPDRPARLLERIADRDGPVDHPLHHVGRRRSTS